ncbi:hypothetical protein MRX96_012638 [Rhipicephalus microplus]
MRRDCSDVQRKVRMERDLLIEAFFPSESKVWCREPLKDPERKNKERKRPTELSPTPVEPTEVPTTSVEPTQLPTTSVEPTELPTTSDQPTELSMTSVKPTDLTTTTVEPTESMGTSTATSPPASNTSTVTEATSEPVFPAQPPMTPFPVVRVFDTATNESQPLPADGVCDYTFYDGLYDTGPFDTPYSPHFSAPVEHVLSHASLHSVTEYDLSFAYRNASQVARDLKIPELQKARADIVFIAEDG